MRLFAIALVLLLYKLLSNGMSTAEFADYQLGIDIALFISLAGSGGLNPGIIRVLAGRTKTLAASQTRMLINRSSLLLFIICFAVSCLAYVLLSFVFCDWLAWPQRIVLASVVCGALLAAHRYLSAVFRGAHSAVWSAALDGRSGGPLAIGLYVTLTIILLFFNYSVDSVRALWILATSLFIAIPIILLVLHRTILKEFPDKPESGADDDIPRFNALFWVSIPFVGSQLVNFASAELDFLIATSTLAKEDASMLGAARRLVVNFQVPTQILMLSTISTVAELHAKKRLVELQRVTQTAAMFAFIVTFPLIVLSIVFREPLLELVYDERYRKAGTVFAILAVGQLVNLLSGHAGQTLGMAGRTHTVTIISLIACFMLLVIGPLVARHYGLTGLAIASTTVTSLQFMGLWIFVRIQTGVWTHPYLHIQYLRQRKTKHLED
jgi:O-antigen/teichoic acid export membrane protein